MNSEQTRQSNEELEYKVLKATYERETTEQEWANENLKPYLEQFSDQELLARRRAMKKAQIRRNINNRLRQIHNGL